MSTPIFSDYWIIRLKSTKYYQECNTPEEVYNLLNVFSPDMDYEIIHMSQNTTDKSLSNQDSK